MNYTLPGSFHDAVTTGTFETDIVAVTASQFKREYTHRASGNGTAPYTCHWYTWRNGAAVMNEISIIWFFA